MGKTVAQWLMKNLEYFVVEASPKLFFSLRDSDSAYTLQCSTNSFGQFLLLTELKVGGYRRSVIIPVGKDKHGWRVFGLELRKILNPSHYAGGGMGLPTFFPQVLRPSVEALNHRTYAEVVQASYGRAVARKLPKQLVSTVKEKMVGNQDLLVPRWEVYRWASQLSWWWEEGIGGSCALKRNLRSGLFVEVDGIGRRRVSWGRKKGGNQNLRWVSRDEKDQCKGVLGLGPNKMATQLPINESVFWSGPKGTSPSTFEHGECSVSVEKPHFSIGFLDKVGESPVANSPSPVTSSPSPELPAQRWRDGPGCSGGSGGSGGPCFAGTGGMTARVAGSISLVGGTCFEGKRTLALGFVPRWAGFSPPDLSLEMVQDGAPGLGVLGQEVITSLCYDFSSSSREVMIVEEAIDSGESDLAVGFPLQTIVPGGLNYLAELEEVNEVMSIESKSDIFGWVKHRIPGFSKLVGLSMSRHEKLCIALLQRLESEMEAANVLNRRVPGRNIGVKSKNKGCRELQNLISSVNYDRR
ncbi:hypothetical protein SO802_029203 [Lithocarpus litseifolius]|uniref:Uncharacterized protein n=1 Tax=Lithocarpus litseifolius TaxID=425828 RepID=A0AAW2BVP4_9ROSI